MTLRLTRKQRKLINRVAREILTLAKQADEHYKITGYKPERLRAENAVRSLHL